MRYPDKNEISRKDKLVLSLSLYAFESNFDDVDFERQMKKQVDEGAKANAETAGAVASAVTGGVAVGAAFF